MRRLLHYLINNIREHLMLYLFLWGLLAIMDLIYVFYFCLLYTSDAADD